MAAIASGGGNNMPNPASSSDVEKESSGKLSQLPPAKLDLGGLKIIKIATGLQHTLLLSKTGEVFAFGSNHNGQLGMISNNTIETVFDLKQTKKNYQFSTFTKKVNQ